MNSVLCSGSGESLHRQSTRNAHHRRNASVRQPLFMQTLIFSLSSRLPWHAAGAYPDFLLHSSYRRRFYGLTEAATLDRKSGEPGVCSFCGSFVEMFF